MIESQLVRSLPAVTLPKLPVIRLAQRSMAAIGIKLAGAGIALALQVALARELGHVDYGNYAYIASWMQLLLLFAQSGLAVATVRFVAEYRAGGQAALIAGYLRRSTQLSLSVAVMLAAVMYFVGAEFGPGTQLEGPSLLIAVLALPAISQYALNCAVIRGLGAALLGMMAQLAYPLLFLGAVLAASLYFEQLDLASILGLNLGAAICALGVALALRQCVQCDVHPGTRPAFRTGQWIATATELLAVTGLVHLQVRTGVIFASLYLNAQTAGTYAALERMADAALLGTIAIEFLAAPKFAELHTLGDLAALQRYSRVAAWGTCLATIAASTLIAFFGRPILTLFGPEFVEGYRALLLMLLGIVIRSACGPIGLLLCMTGFQRDTIGVALISLIFSVCCSLLLTPSLGILGVAAAFGASMALWNVLMLVVARYRLGFWACIGSL